MGYEIFDSGETLGATSFVQNINHLRALEGELARTIRAIDKVQLARVHLVLPGQVGPVTVFFMPGEMADATVPVDSTRFQGEIVPTAWGSIAVVGETGEALEGLGERLVTAVRWPAPQALSDSAALGRTVAVDSRVGQEQDG